MTTIAWDGKHLAADRQVTWHNQKLGETTKAVKRKKDGALCATSGSTPMGEAFKKWFLAGEKGKPPLMKIDGEIVSAVIIYPGPTLVHHSDVGRCVVETDLFAMGSGEDYALGAMAAGKTAAEAVVIASRFNVNTNSNVDVLELGK